MAEQSGTDLLLKILERLDTLEAKVDGINQRLDRTNERIDHTNDTLTLIGSVVKRAVDSAVGRFDDLERRLSALESSPR